MTELILLGVGVLVLLVGLLARRNAAQAREAAGLPLDSLRVVYDDSSADWQRVAQPLFAPAYGLIGKPDYVLQDRRAWIPVEVKPTRTAPAPYESDILQLAAYCLLLAEDDNYGVAPPYGLLRYANKTFRIDYTNALRATLLETLVEMRELRAALPAAYYATEIAPLVVAAGDTVPILPPDVYPIPQHDMSVRCHACRYRMLCWGET